MIIPGTERELFCMIDFLSNPDGRTESGSDQVFVGAIPEIPGLNMSGFPWK
jgi:hypothetical protein